ncbi:MAG: hypothetical protein SPK00_05900 [Corynebacterium glucuronolyticum]|nr:hypothetical protein [Corynebacterium glucuronolyticum]MDD7586025.1 hypothetical protein [Mycobacteriaceae bacterium]MDY5834268.1 hypothetical protein [Corynebacterium glucuronolyticum]
MRRSNSTELADAVLAGERPIHDPFGGRTPTGYEPPRFCQICGRKMAVQVTPHGWVAHCSQHGELNSTWLRH